VADASAVEEATAVAGTRDDLQGAAPLAPGSSPPAAFEPALTAHSGGGLPL